MATLSARRSVPRTPTRSDRPVPTLAFDWIYTLLVFLLGAGIYLDGWSHGTFGPDQSVFSEYHLLFYTSLLTLAVWLFGNAFRWRLAGYRRLNAIPLGYTVSALGVVIFGAAGAIDLVGHALFGFEVELEALYSPSHMGLFLGWALIAVGPARAAAARRDLEGDAPTGWAGRLGSLLPAIVAWASLLNVLAFVSMEFFATSNGWMLFDNRTSNAYFGQVLGILGMIVQTGVIVGCLIWLTSRFRLPFGAVTLFFAVYGLYDVVVQFGFELLPVWLGIGLAVDALHAALRPQPSRPARFHAFNTLTPLLLWSVVYGWIFATGYDGGVWYTPYVWTGSIAQATVTGLLLSLLAGSATRFTREPSLPGRAAPA